MIAVVRKRREASAVRFFFFLQVFPSRFCEVTDFKNKCCLPSFLPRDAAVPERQCKGRSVVGSVRWRECCRLEGRQNWSSCCVCDAMLAEES